VSPARRRRSVSLADAAFWLAPPLLCLALNWRGFTGWFRGDDFAWLGTGIYIQNFHDFLVAIFAPQAQGTIRPLSERLFFLLGFSLFGLDACPSRSSSSPPNSPTWPWWLPSARGSLPTAGPARGRFLR
jgi:hypothetical protein